MRTRSLQLLRRYTDTDIRLDHTIPSSAASQLLGRGPFPVFLAARLICLLLLVAFDLDRPTCGLVTVHPRPRI
jgi:hypothetical protein